MQKRDLFIKAALVFSGTAITVVNCNSVRWIIVNGFISFAIWCFLLFRTSLLNNVFSEHFSKPRIFLSLISSAGIAFSWLENRRFTTTIEILNQYITLPVEYNASLMFPLHIGILFVFGIILMPALFAFLYWFLGILYQTTRVFVRDIKKHEIIYLIITSVVTIVSISAVFNITSVFYEPKINGNVINFDVTYTSDSSVYIKINTFLNFFAWTNDEHQPLFALFAMPFSVYPFLISKLFFFIPNIYPITIQIVQVFLLIITVILISRMIGLCGISAVAFYVIISLSYPYLLFTFMIEQYIFSVFYLILFLYLYLNKDTIFIKNGREVFFIAATGSLITSGILFPCALSHKNKKAVKEIATLGLYFLLAVVLCGKAHILWNFFSIVTAQLTFFGGKSIYVIDRLLQYFNFIAFCIVKPDTIFVHGEFISYQLAPVTSLNYLGILFFIFTIIAFIANRKNKLAQICMVWIVYSFIILCVIGWGTFENGLMLYSLYFAWSFLTLLFMGIEKFFGKSPPLKYCVYAVLILSLIIINIPAIYDIIRFGVTYYPAH